MNVLLVIAEDRSVWEALRASLPEGDLILHEPSVATARRRIASVNVDAIFLDDTSLSGENLVGTDGIGLFVSTESIPGQTSRTVVRGLIINRCAQYGIWITEASNVSVEGCFIGDAVHKLLLSLEELQVTSRWDAHAVQDFVDVLSPGRGTSGV